MLVSDRHVWAPLCLRLLGTYVHYECLEDFTEPATLHGVFSRLSLMRALESL